MTSTKFQQRIACLNEADRERILCAFLTSDSSPPLVFNHELAASQYGSASANSFRVMYGASMRKLKLSDARLNGENVDGDADNTNHGPEQTPKKGAKAGGKRKKAETDGEGTPAKKRASHGEKDVGESNGNLTQGKSPQENGVGQKQHVNRIKAETED